MNSCKHNEDCPEDYFCDKLNGKVCVSKLPPKRMCYNDEMCFCGKCMKNEVLTRKGLKPVTYYSCASC